MAIITSADYPEVRAAIDTELNDKNLPDSTISKSIYHDKAEQDVIDKDPDAASRTGTDGERIKRAVIYYCAAYLVPVVVRLISLSVQARDISYSRPAWDPDERAEELRTLGDLEIEMVLHPEEDDPLRPTMFAVASGYRGW
jgi:hypothetical protein